MSLRFALPAVAAASVAAAGAAPADADELRCGQTITQDTTLTADVTNCPGVGIVIGADGITLDLGGHTVSAAARRNPTAHGIFDRGHHRVTIKNGTVRGFGAYGVRVAQANRVVVQDMKLDANFTGVGLVESARGIVQRTEITGAKFVGVNLTGGTADVVRSNTISNGNGPGIFVQSSQRQTGSNHRITANKLTGNGITVQAGPRRVRLLGNTVSGSPVDGIVVFEPSTILQGNTATGNAVRGIYAPNGMVDAGGNQA